MSGQSSRRRRGRGEGGVHFDEARGLWVGSVSLGYHPDGRRNRPVAYGKTKKDALAEMDRLRREAGRGAPPDAARMTVGELLDLWLASQKGRVADHTYEGRLAASARVRAALGGDVAAKLTALRVARWHQDMADARQAPSARWHAARALSGCLAYGVKLKVVAANVAADVGLPGLPAREMAVLDARQARALMAASAGYVAGPLVAVALGTGLRQGEQLGLCAADVDPAGGSLCVRRALTYVRGRGFLLAKAKTKASRRTLCLPDFALEALREVLAGREGEPPDRTVFCGPSGAHRHRARLTANLKKAIARANREGAGIPEGFTWHSMRHSHASLLLSAGYSIKAVSARLGHASPVTTLRLYAHLLPGDDERLARGMQDLIG